MSYSNVMMLDINISKYEGRKGDKGAGMALDSDRNVKGKGHSVTKITCDAEEMSDYLQPYTDFKKWLNTNCLPIGENRYLFLVDKYQDVVTKVDNFKMKFTKGYEHFCENFYNEIVPKQKNRLNDAWDEADYPSDILSKFGCHVLFTTVPDASSVQKYIGLPQEDVDRLVVENEKAVTAMFETAMRHPYKRIVEVVNKMVEKLSDEGARFKNSLVDNIKEVVDLLPQLNITKSKELEDIADRLNQDLCSVAPDALRYDLNKRKEVVEKAEKIMADLEGYF